MTNQARRCRCGKPDCPTCRGRNQTVQRQQEASPRDRQITRPEADR